jgi:hypothetical protein
MATCGTDTGYKAHRLRGEVACGSCKTAHAIYEYGVTSRRAYQAARQRALSRLASNHREEYAALLAEERERRDAA